MKDFIFKILKSSKLKAQSYKLNRGMTYVELIVVLSIFAIISSIAVFDYGKFQAKIYLKNLGSDMAIKIVEAQKNALSGQYTPGSSDNWTPAYGIYFDLTEDDKSFFYFADLNNDQLYENLTCTGECLDQIAITQGNFISTLEVTGTGSCSSITSLSIVFTRPDSTARMTTNQPACTQISFAKITVSSPNLTTVRIKIYSSGRIQIN